MGSIQSKAGAAPRDVAERVFAVKGRARPRWRPALAGWALRPEPLQKTSEVVLDGIDRRLQRGGLRLVAGGEEPHVRCRLWGLEPPVEDGPREAELEGLPSFAWDFPTPLAHSLVG